MHDAAAIDDPDLQIVDLHNHLVPGVDDGATSVDESLDALTSLRLEGVTTLVATPHLLVPRLETDAALSRELDAHRRAFDQLLRATAARDDVPALRLGQEILAPDAESIRRAARRSGIGLAGTRFLLVEFGFNLQGTHIEVVKAALDAGRQIVIAHPERYHFGPLDDAIDTIRLWHEAGALLQMNAGSLAGHYRGSSPASRTLAWEMVAAGLVDVIATDHHATRRNGVSPREALAELSARGERAQAVRWLAETPGRIVRNRMPQAGAAASR